MVQKFCRARRRPESRKISNHINGDPKDSQTIQNSPDSAYGTILRRPQSEVSDATGIVGAICLAASLVIARTSGMSTAPAMFLLLIATALPMALWAVLIEKVHRRESTGLDFSIRRSMRDVLPIVRVKLIGLGATFALIGACYLILNFYRADQYSFYFVMFRYAMAFFAIAAPFYIAYTTRVMADPKDGLWHFGKLVLFDFAVVDKEEIKEHLLAWAIKGFFLAFLMSIFPSMLEIILRLDITATVASPIALAWAFPLLLFLFDVCFGTIGYIFTLRVLDSHIRSSNPYVGAWASALICYPPIVVMVHGRPFDDDIATQSWVTWLSGQPLLFGFWAVLIVVLLFIYVWATVVFGLRFSNLTNRGIITTGPYRYFKHPAYLSKNLFWWLTWVPFLTTTGSVGALWNCILLLCVNGIYYARAKTEEKHLMHDSRYRAYSAWIARNGLIERLCFRLAIPLPGRRPAEAEARLNGDGHTGETGRTASGRLGREPAAEETVR